MGSTKPTKGRQNWTDFIAPEGAGAGNFRAEYKFDPIAHNRQGMTKQAPLKTRNEVNKMGCFHIK